MRPLLCVAKQRTCEILKSFRCNIYKNHGGWGPKLSGVYHKSQARGVLASREESAGILARRYPIRKNGVEETRAFNSSACRSCRIARESRAVAGAFAPADFQT